MEFFRELYDSSYNYVKGCYSVTRYLNELILKGGVKRVSLLLAISINYDHLFFFFFYMHVDALVELVLKRVEDIVWINFSTQYAICIFYIQSIFAWLSCSPLFFATKNVFFFFFTIFDTI
jgi:hypothetical protein